MANKQLTFLNAARDLTGGQSFDLILIDGGGSYSMYVRNTAQPPSQPGIAALITSVGGTPVIAPGGGGDVVGLGTTNVLLRWSDGPNSVAGDSIVSQNALATILTVTGQQVVTGHVALEGGTPAANDILNITNTAFTPTGISNAINVTLSNATTNVSRGINLSLTETIGAKNSSILILGTHNVTGNANLTELRDFSCSTTILAGSTVTLYLGYAIGLGVQGTVVTGNLLQGVYTGFAGGAVTTLNGLNLAGWALAGGSTVTESRGIFLDTSIDIGTTRYAILSRSTSQSRLVGNVRIGGDTAPVATLDVTGTLLVSTSVTVSGLTANSFLFSGTAGLLTATAAPTNGQLLIGSTGAAPVVASLASSDATIIITAGAGTIDLGTIGTKVFLISQSATPLNLTAAQSQITYTNEGAAASIVANLPTAAAGLVFTFIVQDADGFVVTASAGDTIRLGAAVSSAAGTATSTTIGSVITLVAINATEWIATSIVGTWAAA